MAETQDDKAAGEGGPLSRGLLLAYGLPGLPLALVPSALVVFVPDLYAREIGLGLATTGVVLMLASIVEMALSPLLGAVSDRVVLPLGRRRPWLVLALPLVLIAGDKVLMPAHGVGPVYLAIWLSLLLGGLTLMRVCHGAWGAELSGAYHQRTRLFGVRALATLLGFLLAAVTPALLRLSPPGHWLGTGPVAAGETLFLAFTGVLPLTLAVLLGAVPEPRDLSIRRPRWRRSLRRLLIGNRPLVTLLGAILFNGLANGIPAALFLLYVTQVLGAGRRAGLLLGLAGMAALLSLPLWVWLAGHFGKHRLWIAAMIWAAGVLVTVPFIGFNDVRLFAAVCVFGGAALAADLVLPPALLADVIDRDCLIGGEQRAGLLFGLLSLIGRLAPAVAVGLIFPVLALLGIHASGDASTTDGRLGLVVLFGLAPVLFKAVAIALIWDFPLDAEHQRVIRRRIERRAVRAGAESHHP